MPNHTLKKFFHSGATLDVVIDVDGYSGSISEKSLKGIADLLYAGNTKRLHKSAKVKGIAVSQTYLHEDDDELLEVKKYKEGEIKKEGKTAKVTKIGEITIGKTGKVRGGVHKFD
jgi:hypothetical protein